MKKLVLIWLVLATLAITGEVKCIVKMIKCNWEPIGKAEIIYTAATFTGLGSIVGWIDIKDE